MAHPAADLEAVLAALDLTATATLEAGVPQLYALLIEANRETNLTRITDFDDYLVKHIGDSLSLLPVFPALHQAGTRIIDVGCGAGFPCLPLAMSLPRAQLVGIDSAARKANFVSSAAAALGLTNLTATQARARELARQAPHRRAYDFVLARAVGATAELIRECRQLLAPGGCLVAYKTPRLVAAEDALARREADKAGLTLSYSPIFTLPATAGDRQFCVVQQPAP